MFSYIKSMANNNLVSAEDQGNSPLVANRTVGQRWETFDVIHNSDGTISFLSAANDKYVTTDLNKETKLIARAIQDWEKFKQIDRGDGKVALQAVANSLYVCADMNKGGVLYANRSAASGWEEFIISAADASSEPQPGGFLLTEQQFNQIFPGRNHFYTYSGLVVATSAYPGFANTGDMTIRKQEAAAFLANVHHETGGLHYVVESNRANYSHYSDYSNTRYPVAPGKQYYGRGPLQISWNYNYGAAGEALGLPILKNPDLVAQDASVAWKTALWFWNTQTGAGTMTGHDAMVKSRGFGETIRTINGALECNRGGTGPVQNRIAQYKKICSILGADPGTNLSC
jgi:predicted chitinase